MSLKSPTICDYVLKMPSRKEHRTAILFKERGSWVKLSWLDYYDHILTVASAMLDLGIKPKDKVAIMASTRFEWSVCDYATMGLQAITVPIYQTVTAEDLKYILNDSQARVLYVENRAMLKTFLKVKDSCPHVHKVICFDPPREGDSDMTSWHDFYQLGAKLKNSQRSQFEELCGSTELSDVATVIYTSGTTGKPKGVVLSHEQIMSEVSDTFSYVGVNSDDVSLSFLPYAHVLGRIEEWGHVYIGFQLAYAESIEKIRTNLTEIRPTILVSVPRIFEKIYTAIHAQLGSNLLRTKAFQWALSIGLQAGEYRMNRQPLPASLFAQLQLAQRLALDKIKNAFGGRLRFAVSGGAPISQDIELFFHACGILILEGYGLTETTAAICANAPFNYRFGSVGRPVGDVRIKIAEDGEILVQSKKVMKEYLHDPEATAAAFTDGWFHTGDIGEFLPSGDLKITDRKKDLIKTAGGKYVAPQKLESLLKKNSLISQVLIHGDNKKYIVALITLDATSVTKFAKETGLSFANYESLTQHPAVLEGVRRFVAEVNSKLASYETIKRFSVLPKDFTVEDGELTPSLKIKRKILDQKYKKQLDALYG